MHRERSPWFLVPNPNPQAAWRLFCLPFAGGGASTYRPWGRALAAHPVEVCAVQPPGRENRIIEEPCTTMPALVEEIAQAMQPLLDRPYALFGHSMGATVAFELSHTLHQRGLPMPRHLFAAGALAPDADDPDEPLHRIVGDDAFVTAVARRFGGVPQEVLEHAELRALIAPALRADLAIHETRRHIPRGPLEVDITAYGGVHDHKVSAKALQRWGIHTARRFTWRLFDGGHFFVQDAHTAVLTDLLERAGDLLQRQQSVANPTGGRCPELC